MKRFQEFGKVLDGKWSKLGYDIERFPDLACEVLQEQDFSDITKQDIVEWTTKKFKSVKQVGISSSFGEPPLTVFSNDKFYLEILFWLTSTTAIHGHSFVGAFHVLDGASLHSTYEFNEEIRVCDDLLIGEVKQKNIEYLTKGCTRKISASDEFIHALYHLGFPSISLVVRTHYDDRRPIQYAYYRPNFAINEFKNDAHLTRLIQTATMLKNSEENAFVPYLNSLFENASVYEIVTILSKLIRSNILMGAEKISILNKLEASNDQDITKFLPLFHEYDRLLYFQKIRRKIQSPSQRLLISLLLYSEGRDQIFNVIKTAYSVDPVTFIFENISEMNENSVFEGVFNNFQLDAIDQLLRYEKKKDFLNALRKKYGDEIDNNQEQILKMVSEITSMPFLNNLLVIDDL